MVQVNEMANLLPSNFFKVELMPQWALSFLAYPPNVTHHLSQKKSLLSVKDNVDEDWGDNDDGANNDRESIKMVTTRCCCVTSNF